MHKIKSCYRCNSISSKQFYLYGFAEPSKRLCEESVAVVHSDPSSGASDKLNYSVVSMTFTAFVDQPVPHKRIAAVIGKSGAVEVGHAWWQLDCSLPSLIEDAESRAVIGKTAGFYPVKRPENVASCEAGVIDIPDNKHRSSVSYKWKISDQGLAEGLSEVVALRKDPPEYRPLERNCVDVLITVGKAAGVSVPDSKGGVILRYALGMPVQAEYDIKFSNAGDLGENLRALKKRGR